jgi:O-antigen/teichoic acid export membrane protein
MFQRVVIDYYVSRKEHIVNVSSFFINRIFSLSLFAVTTSIFINRAGSELFGILTMLLLIFNYISLADLGMGYAVGYRLTRAISRQNKTYAIKILKHALPFYFIIGLLSGLAVFCFSSQLSLCFTKTENYSFLYKIISFSIFPLLLDAIVLMVLQAFNKIFLVNASRLIYDFFRGAPLLLVLVAKNDLFELIMIIIVIGCYLKLVVDSYIAYRLLGTLSWIKPNIMSKELKFNIKYGMPMLVTLVIGLIITSIDKFYITNFMSMEQLAYYSVALEINVKAWFLVWAVTGSLQTVLIRRNVAKRNTIDLQKISFYSVALIFAIYYVPLMLFSKQILSLWINKDFADKSYILIRILCFYSLFYMLYAVKHSFLQAQGRFMTITGIYALGLTILLVSLLFLSKYFGLEGVAFSYVITYAVFVASAIVCMRKVKTAHA